MSNVYVTKPFLPPLEDYVSRVKEIYQNGTLTNQGPLVQLLESKLKAYLDVEHFHFLANGTVSLSIALNALGITTGEIITTPFSYVATTSSILWERCTPRFVDIEPNNFTIDAARIENAINENTKAIMAVHVFGYACDVTSIEKIAKKHSLKVIYDAAHAFGVRYKGKSLLSYGDISTLSFHATKLFHTVEGGACITSSKELSDKMELIKRFGHHHDDHVMLGLNGKNSEFHAAMGLANYPYIAEIISTRKAICEKYDQLLTCNLQRPAPQEHLEYNYAYYPVVLPSEKALLEALNALNNHNIYPRRYFYPSLNTLPYIHTDRQTDRQTCENSEDISRRILCLPLYPGLSDGQVDQIASILNRCP